jgi:hypothetical protein
VAFLISIYIYLPWDYKTCGVSYFYLHVSLGLLDLWPFLFLFTYFSPGITRPVALFLFTYVSPRITRPVAFLISIYIYLPWDYKTCGGRHMLIEIRNATGLVIPEETYVNRNKKYHRSNNPRGDICK